MSLLFWLDMEMTGLDVEKEVIIEVAAIITDYNFKEISTYEAVVKQPQNYLDSMDEWNKTHHTDSGLLHKIPFGKDPRVVEKELINLITQFFPDPKNKPMLAGNSIAQDRLFIDKYFKDFSHKLHYRMLDVSSWKIMFVNKLKKEFKKKNQHRALDDIRESIGELKFYMGFINPNI
ncbi:MAG: oligoribonuclease [Bdellovibrionaceae bacterium]|nr:oligoribonuclease [Pseudobdellovibrionaceae bacterium]NUM59888.1 oligoribonuclease [Pseudobdellovibrionaceae bacterium]